MKKGILYGVIAVLVLLCIGGGFFLLSSKNSSVVPKVSEYVLSVPSRIVRVPKQFLTAQIDMSVPGTAYYIDATAGSDANVGTSPDSPWKTLAKANGKSLQPGDAILLKRGSVWGETLAVSSSGNADNAVRYGAYGSGEDPLIDAAIGGKQACVVVSNKSYVVLDGIACRNAQGPAEGGIQISGGNYITIQNNSVRNGANGGITLKNTSNAIVQNNTVENIRGMWGEGIQAYASAGQNGLQNVVVSGNIVHGTQGSAILIQDTDMVRVSGNTISNAGGYGVAVAPRYRSIQGTDIYDNIIHDVSLTDFSGNQWSASGISAGAVTNMTHLGVRIYRNTIYNVKQPSGVDGNGIIVDIGAHHAEVYENTIYNTDSAGILFVAANDGIAHHNVIYNCGANGPRGTRSGLGAGRSTGITFSNNTIYNCYNGIRLTDNSSATVRNNIFANSSASHISLTTSFGTFDYNLYYPDTSGSANKFSWPSHSTASFSAWKSESQQDAHSVLGNPLFVNAAGAGFSLTQNSPAVGAGTPAASDIGALAYTGPRISPSPVISSPSPLPAPTPTLSPSPAATPTPVFSLAPNPSVSLTTIPTPSPQEGNNGGGNSGGGGSNSNNRGGGGGSAANSGGINSNGSGNSSSNRNNANTKNSVLTPVSQNASVAELQQRVQELSSLLQNLIALVMQKKGSAPVSVGMQLPVFVPVVPVATVASAHKLSRDLGLSAEGEDVRLLQKFLNQKGFLVATSGAGAPGHETAFFGGRTAKALAKFQKAHKLPDAAGTLGKNTREYINTQLK